MQNRVLNTMHEKLGVDVSEAALREAVERHNEVCRVMTEISEFRKLANPPITGYEFPHHQPWSATSVRRS